MTIAIYAGKAYTQQSFQAFFSHLVNEHPEDNFIFFTGKNSPPFITAPNTRFIDISPDIKNSLVQHYWLNYKLPRQLRKYNVDHFISCSLVVSLRTTIYQSIWWPYLHLPVRKKTGYESKSFTAKYLQKAVHIFLSYPSAARELVTRFPASNYTVIYLGLDEQKKMDSGKLLPVFESSYLVCEVSGVAKEELIEILKAYSKFMLWQKSSMKLVLLHSGEENDLQIPGFTNYKFKDNVFMIAYNDDATMYQTIGAAFAILVFGGKETSIVAGLAAMQKGIPVISRQGEMYAYNFGDAALFCETTPVDTSKAIIHIYKDERTYKIMAARGRSHVAPFTWQNSSDLLWETIQTL